MEHKQELKEMIAFYRERGAARDQNELVQLCREVQALFGGVIPHKALEKIADKLELKMTFLDAVLKRYPTIRTAAAPHVLAVCGGKKCSKNDLASFVEQTYCVQSGETADAGFHYKVAGCMKKCGKGPCVKWDGEVYTGMTEEKLRDLISGKK